MERLNIANVNKQSDENSDARELISFLKDIQGKIPKAIKELETDNYGRGSSITPVLIGKLIRTSQEGWYTDIFE